MLLRRGESWISVGCLTSPSGLMRIGVKMTLYVYEKETLAVTAKINAKDNRICEDIAAEKFDSEYYGQTYTPEFGTADGLIDGPDAEKITYP